MIKDNIPYDEVGKMFVDSIQVKINSHLDNIGFKIIDGGNVGSINHSSRGSQYYNENRTDTMSSSPGSSQSSPGSGTGSSQSSPGSKRPPNNPIPPDNIEQMSPERQQVEIASAFKGASPVSINGLDDALNKINKVLQGLATIDDNEFTNFKGELEKEITELNKQLNSELQKQNIKSFDRPGLIKVMFKTSYPGAVQQQRDQIITQIQEPINQIVSEIEKANNEYINNIKVLLVSFIINILTIHSN